MSSRAIVRDLEHAKGDIEAVLAINQASLPHVSALTREALERLCAMTSVFRVVERDGRVAAFLMAMTPDAAYESINFGWFKSRYPKFLYVDRVAVASAFQRSGFGSLLYRDVAERAQASRIPLVTCEINVRPPNPESLAFHERHGFEEVGQQETEGGTKTVSLRVKRIDV